MMKSLLFGLILSVYARENPILSFSANATLLKKLSNSRKRSLNPKILSMYTNCLGKRVSLLPAFSQKAVRNASLNVYTIQIWTPSSEPSRTSFHPHGLLRTFPSIRSLACCWTRRFTHPSSLLASGKRPSILLLHAANFLALRIFRQITFRAVLLSIQH